MCVPGLHQWACLTRSAIAVIHKVYNWVSKTDGSFSPIAPSDDKVCKTDVTEKFRDYINCKNEMKTERDGILVSLSSNKSPLW